MGDLVTMLREAGYSAEDAAQVVGSLDDYSLLALERDLGVAPAPYWKYAYEPEQFIAEVLNEQLWSTQRLICQSVIDNERTAVPACHSPGKTHLAARLVGWWVNAWPVGSAAAVTTATNFRTVRNQLWPHVRRLKDRHGLPGRMNQTEWWIGEELVAWGFSAADTDPESVAGIHVPHLLVLVDESGGISHAIGEALESLLTGGHVRIVAIGNPSTDEEDTWFQRACESQHWNTIPIPAESTPNFTGEDAGECRSCVDWRIRPHRVNEHLLSEGWVAKAKDDHGEESAYVIAKVMARFPDIIANRVIPVGWVERAQKNEPEDGTWIRMGVDVASDGGDECVISRSVGSEVKVTKAVSGASLANAVDVAGFVLEEIALAEAIRAKLGEARPIRVKVDAIGVGWGVTSTLEKWGQEGLHHAEIVGVSVGERARNPDKFVNQRAEMHWNLRELLQPPGKGEPDDGIGLHLDVDSKVAAQLAQAKYVTTSAGKIQIEGKDSQKKRGLGSPDRAESIMLCLYEPPEDKPKKKKVRIIL